MKIKADIKSVVRALTKVSPVKPVLVDGNAGYLFKVVGSKCFVYSDDGSQKTRAYFPLIEADGEGSFVFPVKGVAPLSLLSGDVTFSFFASDPNTVEYRGSEGASQKLPTFAPQALQALDVDLDKAETVCSFRTAVLRDAILTTRGCLADPSDSKAKEPHKCLQAFDTSNPAWADGDGFMFATSGFRSCYYYSEELEGKGLVIHGANIPLLASWLAKSGDVSFRRSTNNMYFVDEDDNVVGWPIPTASHAKFGYYGLAQDSHVLRVDREELNRAMAYVRKALDPKRDRASLQYDAEQGVLRLLAADGPMQIEASPIRVTPKGPEDSSEDAPVVGGDKSKTDSFKRNIPLSWLIEMVAATKGCEVELRVSPYPNRDGQIFRTVEKFYLDDQGRVQISNGNGAKLCRITYMLPVRD